MISIKTSLLKFLLLAVMTSLFFIIPPPSGLALPAWHLFGIFTATILALILQPFPEPTILLISLAVTSALVIPLQDILVGYMDGTLWLTATAIMISIGLKKSGLTRRIGLLLISRYGTTSLRIGYIISCIDLVLATSTPASPARTGGLVYPLAEGIIEVCQSSPATSPRRIGAYLIVLMYMVSMTTGSLFMTGMGPNLINVKLAQDMLGLTITWPLWSLGALPGFLSFLLLPYLIYKLYPPELRSLDLVRQEAKKQLQSMDKLSQNELIMAFIFLLILGLWATTAITHMDASLVGFIGVALMLLSKAVQWQDLAEDTGLWSLFIWFGAILGMSAALIKFGFFSWFAEVLKAALPTSGLNHYWVLLLVAALSIFPHYFFASLGGYVAAFSSLIFSFISATDVPRYPAFFLLAYLMVVSCSLTHYGNALGPTLMSKGYTDKKTWWQIGLIITLLQAIMYLTLGVFYWKIIGLWY